MKLMIIGATLAGFAAVAPLSAQSRGRNQGVPPGQMPPAGMCRVWIDGVPPGRQPRATDCASARASVPANGRVIYGSNGDNRNNRQDCNYSQSTNTVGDIIFGRSSNNTTNCVDNTSNRVNGGWYQVGRDNNGDTIYERQTRDQNGNLIIQRARRNSNGSLSIISTRNAGNVNGRNNNGTYNNGRNDDGGTYNRRTDRDDEQGNNDDENDQGKGQKNKGNNGHGKGKGHNKD